MYGLVGLVPTVAGFWKFMLVLVLFNLTTASVVLWLSIGFASVSVASLVGTLIMLFKFRGFSPFTGYETNDFLFCFVLVFYSPVYWLIERV